MAGVFELDSDNYNSREHESSELPSSSVAVTDQSPDWPSCYALDENLHEPSHPLFHDVPAHPLLAAKIDTAGATAVERSEKSRPFVANADTLGAHVNTQLFLSRGHTATQLHRDPFDNV